MIGGQGAGGGPEEGSMIKRNIVYHVDPDIKTFTNTRMFKPLNAKDIDDNLYHMEGTNAAAEFLADMQEKGWDKHSLAADPLFEDVRNLDFRLKAGSPAFKLGIKPVEGQETIGLLGDPALARLRKEGGLAALMKVELHDSEVFIIDGHRPSQLLKD